MTEGGGIGDRGEGIRAKVETASAAAPSVPYDLFVLSAAEKYR